jgi:hypothetical protein
VISHPLHIGLFNVNDHRRGKRWSQLSGIRRNVAFEQLVAQIAPTLLQQASTGTEWQRIDSHRSSRAGFADAGISRNQHELRPAALNDPFESGEQGFDFALSPIGLLGNQQPVGYVVLPKRELVDAPLTRPIGKTAAQIASGGKDGPLVLRQKIDPFTDGCNCEWLSSLSARNDLCGSLKPWQVGICRERLV